MKRWIKSAGIIKCVKGREWNVEYIGLKEISGPLFILEGVKDASSGNGGNPSRGEKNLRIIEIRGGLCKSSRFLKEQMGCP